MQWGKGVGGGVTQQSASALHSVPVFSASFASVSRLKTTKAALVEVFKSTSCQQRDYLCLSPFTPNRAEHTVTTFASWNHISSSKISSVAFGRISWLMITT